MTPFKCTVMSSIIFADTKRRKRRTKGNRNGMAYGSGQTFELGREG